LLAEASWQGRSAAHYLEIDHFHEHLFKVRRPNAEAQRFAQIRREFHFFAFRRVPLRLCVKIGSDLVGGTAPRTFGGILHPATDSCDFRRGDASRA